MVVKTRLPVTEEDYDLAAREFEARLTLEDIMESTWQAKQRHITMDTLSTLAEHIPGVEAFNELLVQVLHDGALLQVVPDNMFLVTPHPHRDRRSFNTRLEPVGPFMTMEYVSAGSARKDYELKMQRYGAMKVPYYLIFDPESRDLEVYRWGEDGYVRLEPDTNGRIAVPELDVQIGLLNGWVRMWHGGELLLTTWEKSQVVAQQDRTIADKDAQLQQMLNFLRSQVELRARQRGRDDVLQRLAATNDLGQLQRWFTELV